MKLYAISPLAIRGDIPILFKKIFSENMNRLKYSNDNQAIYQIVTNMGVDQQSFDAGGGFEIQQRVLKELGYPERKKWKRNIPSLLKRAYRSSQAKTLNNRNFI